MTQSDETPVQGEDEVTFWLCFIAWWEAKEGKPATLRMREALAYAEAKRLSPGLGAINAGIDDLKMH